MRFARDHVVGRARLEEAHGHDSGVLRIDVAADDGLQRHHDAGARHHRIEGGVRMGGMAALAGDADVPAVRRGEQWSRARHDVAERHARLVVDREHRVAGEFLEQAVLDHRLAAATAFLRGLEDEVHGALEVAALAQHLGRAEQHRGVAIMAAGMHAARVLRAMLEIVPLVHRQAVHVGSQANSFQRVALAQGSDQAGLAQPARHLEAPFGELGGDDVGGARLLVGELGMGVDVATDVGDLALDLEGTRQDRHDDSGC
jgi:hypothetical protein